MEGTPYFATNEHKLEEFFLAFNFQIIVQLSLQLGSKLFGVQEAKYSCYTCYSGLTNFVPPYIDIVGYVT